MQIDNRLLDDFTRVASGALGMMARLKDEVAVLVRQQMDNLLANMELVTREEFEAVREMAAKARDEQEKMAERLAALETRLGHEAQSHPKKPHKPD
jgi:BMFP domain-containing protein YqiC